MDHLVQLVLMSDESALDWLEHEERILLTEPDPEALQRLTKARALILQRRLEAQPGTPQDRDP